MEKHSTGKNTAALGDAELLYNEYWMSDETYERFHEFKGTVLGIEDEKTPSERSAFYKRTRLVILTACFIFIFANVTYLFTYLLNGTDVLVDLIALILLPSASIAVVVFNFVWKDYDSKMVRLIQGVFYTIIAASVTMFVIAADIEKSRISISMCYLFVFFVAPPFDLLDSIVLAVMVLCTGVIPAFAPGAEMFPMLPHLVIRGSVVIGMFFVRTFMRKQAADENKLLAMNNTFVKLAYVDIMTSAINSKGLQAYKSYVRQNFVGHSCGVLIYDIDNFKSYNDTYSHMAGDDALSRTSKAAIGVLKNHGSYLFRYGGEEFMVLLPDVDKETMISIGKELMQVIHDENIKRDDYPGFDRVSITIGACVTVIGEKGEVDPMKMADDQLYVGKNNGRNCMVIDGVFHRLGS